jgi:hypothetical protein
MKIQLKIKDITTRKLVSNDMSYRIVLEGVEGCDYADEYAELIKLQSAGELVTLTTDETKDTSD